MDAADIGAAMARRLGVPQGLMLAQRALAISSGTYSRGGLSLHRGLKSASRAPRPASPSGAASHGIGQQNAAASGESAPGSALETGAAPTRIAAPDSLVRKVRLLSVTSSVSPREFFADAGEAASPTEPVSGHRPRNRPLVSVNSAVARTPGLDSAMKAPVPPANRPDPVARAKPKGGNPGFFPGPDPRYDNGDTRGGWAPAPGFWTGPIGLVGRTGALAQRATARAEQVLQQGQSPGGNGEGKPSQLAPLAMAFAPSRPMPDGPTPPTQAGPQNATIPGATGGLPLAAGEPSVGVSAGSAPGGPTQGDVYLDGTLMGRWMVRALAADAARPASGNAAFDPRRAIFPAGAMIGG
jgi:hypothetical protein